MARYPWSVLGIEKTTDERAIKSAYAGKLKVTRPEDDAGAFQQLVEARELALNYARRPPQTRKKSKNAGQNRDKRKDTTAHIALTSTPETTEIPALLHSTSSEPAPIQIPVQDEPDLHEDRLAAAICHFLRPEADIDDETSASAAIEELAAGSIAQKAAVETTLLNQVEVWLERQRQALENGASHKSGMHLYNLQKLAVIRLDMQYGWSEDIRRLHMLTPFAKELTDELHFIRHGSNRDQVADLGMPIWLKIFGQFFIAYGVISLFFRILIYLGE